MYKLLIFDLDNTLIDYSTTERLAIENICQKLCIATKDCYRLYRDSNRLAREIYPNITHEKLLDFRKKRAEYFLQSVSCSDTASVDCFLALYLAEMSKGIVFDDVIECLERLKGQCVMVIGTNGDNVTRYNKVKSANLTEYFPWVFTSEMLNCSKPQKEFFLKIIEQFPYDVESVLAIGDDLKNDYICAKDAGIDFCFINRKRIELNKNVKPQYVIYSLAELEHIVNAN
ncbi:MAG: HAD family hydrolase [Clostridiales bacterium]|nr:HAD family hydrolase [Clostridiales bacterium]